VKGLVASAALITCLLLGGCTRYIPNASYEDGYYWYQADGVSIITAKTQARESLSVACSSEVGHMPKGDNSGQWKYGCVSAAHGDNLP
jgi:hypothetical protein